MFLRQDEQLHYLMGVDAIKSMLLERLTQRFIQGLSRNCRTQKGMGIALTYDLRTYG